MICAELLQAMNADLNGAGVPQGDVKDRDWIAGHCPLIIRRDFRHVELGIHEQREFERPAESAHPLSRELLLKCRARDEG